MNLSSTFQAEAFRPIATIAVPGATAVFPYILIVTNKYGNLISFWDKHEATFIAITSIIIIAVGLILEDIGSEIESRIWDSLCKRNNSCHENDWYSYLRLVYDKEPIGQRYLRTVILRMKFELGFAISLIPFWIGMLWLNSIKSIFSKTTTCWTTLGVMVLFMYLLWESYSSSRVLGRIRAELLKAKASTLVSDALVKPT